MSFKFHDIIKMEDSNIGSTESLKRKPAEPETDPEDEKRVKEYKDEPLVEATENIKPQSSDNNQDAPPEVTEKVSDPQVSKDQVESSEPAKDCESIKKQNDDDSLPKSDHPLPTSSPQKPELIDTVQSSDLKINNEINEKSDVIEKIESAEKPDSLTNNEEKPNDEISS